MHIMIFLLYILYFRIVLDSGLSADDMWNYNIKASEYTGGPNVWELTWNQFFVWLDMGRLFPFSNYVYILFQYVPSIAFYKVLVMLCTYISNLLCGISLKKITGQWCFGYMYMLLFLVFIQLTPEFDSALYCYHMLVQLVVIWCFLSLWLMLQYLDTKKKRYMILSIVSYFIALGTYEVAYVFIFVLLLGIIIKERKWKEIVRTGSLYVAVILIMGMLNVYLRVHGQTVAYDGIRLNLHIKPMIITLLKQCSTCFPIGRYICYGVRTTEPYSYLYPYNVKDIIKEVQALDVLVIVLFVGIFIVIERKIFTEKCMKKDTLWLIVGMGATLFLITGTLIAVSMKYQNMLGWCSGHLPAYIQSMGLSIVILGIYAWLCWQEKKWKKIRILRFSCAILAIIVLLLNQITGRIGVEYMNLSRKYPQECLGEAANEGLFDEVAGDSGKIVFGITDYIYDISASRDFYSRYSKNNIYAVPRQDVIETLKDEGLGAKVYEIPADREQQFYAVYTVADQKNGLVIMGKCHSLQLDDAKVEFAHLWIENPKIYVYGNAYLPERGQGEMYQLEGCYDLIQVKNTKGLTE